MRVDKCKYRSIAPFVALATLVAIAAHLSITRPALAGTFYNFGSTGAGPWDDATTAVWGTVTGGPYNTTWTSGSTATFETSGGAVTVSGTINSVTGLTFNTTGYSLSGGTITLTGAPAINANFANTSNTTISSSLTSGAGVNWSKTGNGKVTLSGSTSLGSGNLTFSDGTLSLSGTQTGTIGAITVGNGGQAADGWLEVASGASWTASSLAYSGVNSVMHHNAGALTTTGNFSVDATGINPFNAYYMAGGTLDVQGTWRVGDNSQSVMGFHMSGGTVTANGGTDVRVGGSAANAGANMTVAGTGSFSTNKPFRVGATTSNPLSRAAVGGSGQLTASNAAGIELGSTSAAAGTGTLHIHGGTVTTTTLTKHATGNGFIIFNGGTLQAFGSGNTYANFVASNLVANIYSRGAIIDTNNNDATVNASLLASGLANTGVTAVAISSPGSNYSFPSVSFVNTGNMLTFTGGTGTAATAAVVLDANGGIAEVVMLTPGAYTVAPTGVSLASSVAGPNNTAVTFGAISTASNTDGGLRKIGTGTLTLASGTSTYVGRTLIEAGTLSVGTLANGGANSGIGASSNAATSLVLNGGTLRYTGAGVSTDRLFSVGTSNGTLEANGSGAVNFTNAGAMGFNSQSGARMLTLTGTNTGANTIAAVIGDNGGATALTKVGAGQWVLSGNNTYTGNTDINQGTLALSNANNNNIAGSPLITLVGGAFLDTTGLGGAVDLILASGQTLTGTGTVTGNLTVGSGSTIAPGASPGTLIHNGNETWAVNGNYEFEINDATGTFGADPGWDLMAISGSLDLSALSSGNEFDVELVSLTLGNAPGNAANFNPANSYAWKFADAGSTISTYTGTSQFDVVTTAFTNPFTGTFTVLRGDNPAVTALVMGANDTELYIYYTDAVEVVPEPGTLALAALGLMGLVAFAARRRK